MVRPRADPALGVAEALIKYSEADVRGGPATAATGHKQTLPVATYALELQFRIQQLVDQFV